MSDAHRPGNEDNPELPDRPSRVFLSYSHRDGEHLSDLKDHLSPLVRQRKLEIWYDREINAGDAWEDAIVRAMEATDIFLMLVSPSFIASDYAYGKELTFALKRQADEGAVVIPIIVRPCAWNASPVASPLAQLQALPRDGEAVTLWPNRDEAWLDVVRGMDRVAERLRANRQAGSDVARPDLGTLSVPDSPGLVQYVSDMQSAIVDIWERLGRLDETGNQFQIQMTRVAAPPLAPNPADPTAAIHHAAGIIR
ncbi:MAG: toll/interleukin-1 receptor domain-containing protein, partial [Rubrobacteraceae bacterium]